MMSVKRGRLRLTLPILLGAMAWSGLLSGENAESTAAEPQISGPEVESSTATVVPASDEVFPRGDSGPKASPAHEDPERFRFGLSIYGWTQTIEGTVTAGGVKSPPIYIPFTELIQDINVAFEVYAEARWKRWFASFDGTWVGLKGESSTSLSRLNVSLDQTLYDIHLGYDLYRCSKAADRSGSGDRHLHQTVLSLYCGARYTRYDINVDGSVLFIPFDAQIVNQRWDPLVGVRLSHAWNSWLVTAIRGDVGGFGMGEAADFTWEVQATVGVRVYKPIYLNAGYRALGADTVRDGNGSDLIQHGLVIGASVTF